MDSDPSPRDGHGGRDHAYAAGVTMTVLDTLKSAVTVPAFPVDDDPASGAGPGPGHRNRRSDPTADSDPQQLFSPSLLLESLSFGLIDDSTLEETGIPRVFDTSDLEENNAVGDSGGTSARNLQIVAYVGAFVLATFAVGQLFTFELGS